MAFAVADLPRLREGVAVLPARSGLLLQDALRWQVFFVPGSAPREGALRFLEGRGLLEGAPSPKASPRLSQIFLVPAEQAPDGGLRLQRDARFSCACCGESCRNLNLGPLLPADVDRLLALDWNGKGHDPARFFVDRDGDPADEERVAGRRNLFLRRVGNGCQFLRPDNLCEVHARFGAAAKPYMCRAFPLQFRAGPAGVVVGMRLGECLEAERVSEGEPIGAREDELRALYRELVTVPVLPALVWLTDGGALASFAEYEELEARVLAAPVDGTMRGDAHRGGLALLLRALDAVEARGSGKAPAPADAATLARLRAWSQAAHEEPSRLPLAGPPPAEEFAGEALPLEERICRLALAGKDAFQHGDLASGIALLAVECWLARFRALALAGAEGRALATGRDLNTAWKLETQLHVRSHLAEERISSRALAAAIGAADRSSIAPGGSG